MFLDDLQQPMVLDLPEGLIGLVLDQKSQVRRQLPESDIRREQMNVGELLHQFMLGRGDHGMKSPTLGSLA